MNLSLNQHLIAIKVSGRDAYTFLTGQFTNEVSQSTAHSGVFGGFCNSKGRLLGLAHIGLIEQDLLMVVERSGCDELLANLRRYVMRAQVVFEQLPDWPLQLRNTPPSDAAGWLLGSPETAALWLSSGAAPDDDSAVKLALIRHGWPRIFAITSATLVPQMVNLDLLNGISFSKGCYTGQEIIARTHNLGTIKRRMLRFVSEQNLDIAAGARIVNRKGSAVGVVIDACDEGQQTELLASIRLAERDAGVAVEGYESVTLSEQALPYSIDPS